MILPKLTKANSSYITVVIFFTITVFSINAFVINKYIIQYSSMPEVVSFQVWDASVNDSVTFNLPVTSKLGIDAYKKETAATGEFIENNILYNQNPIFLIWHILILIMISIAAGSFLIFISKIVQLKSTFNLSLKRIGISIIFALLVAILILIINLTTEGYYRPPKILNDFNILLEFGHILSVIVVETIVLVFPIYIVFFLIGPCSDKLFDCEFTKAKVNEVAAKLEVLNQTLNLALRILAVIVVFSVLTSSSLRESIKNIVQIEGYEIFPTEISYVYGLSFSLFLSVLYLPVYYYLTYQYNRLKEIVTGIQESPGVDKDWSQSILATVNIKNSAMDNIKLGLTVLAPFISSILPESLNFLS